ncbi:MAG: hypothetical protein IPJ84_16775 [Bdellovibrionales bacterium]|nr:hypothetical protein [Bdellovibrionales bacterium]
MSRYHQTLLGILLSTSLSACSTTPSREPATTQSSTLQFIKIEKINFTDDILSPVLGFEVPPHTISFTLNILGDKNCSTYLVNRLTAPNGKDLINGGDSIDLGKLADGPNRSTLGIIPGTGGLLVPNHPSVKVSPGKWKLQLAGCHTTTANVTIALKVLTAPPKDGEIHLRIFLTGAHGWTKKTAGNNKDFLEMIKTARSIFARADIKLTIDDISSIAKKHLRPSLTKIDQLTELASPGNGQLNVFVVEKLTDNLDGMSLSLGVPGPVGPEASANSGVLVFAESAGSKTSPHELGVFLAHEIGHYLGLYHVSDSVNGPDLLSDTDIADELNLMNKAPFAFGSLPTLTPQQIQLLRQSPLVTNNASH